MRILMISILFFCGIVLARDRDQRHKSIETTVIDWITSAEQAVEKKDFVKALQLYGALRDKYEKDGNLVEHEKLGTLMNRIYWYCVAYYYFFDNEKEVRWFIDQRLSRNAQDAEAIEFLGYLNTKSDEKIKEFLDKRFWGIINTCIKEEKTGDEYGQARWWLRKKLEIQPDDEKAKRLLQVFETK